MPITDLISYDDIVALGKQNSGNILLEIGPACMSLVFVSTEDTNRKSIIVGIELRQLVSDGYPVGDVIALELFPGKYAFKIIHMF
jgi:hypothetical protein